MHVVIVGGHARTALMLGGLLTAGGHEVTGTVRDPAQGAELSAAAMRAAVVDLERATTGALARLLTGHDAVVYAAGAGYGSSTRQKTAIDRDAAIRTIDAARLCGVRRFVMISSMGVDLPALPGAFGTYLRLKGEADAYLRSADLDWTIVRPSGLTDGPATGKIRVGRWLTGGALARADLAALLARVLVHRDGVRRQFDVTGGTEDLTTVTL
jgi:uncharacterized protein YbjT (DUF2867 family)